MNDYRAYLIDLDGVVYRGDQRLPGAAEFVAWLEATGRDYRYVSNNSMQDAPAVAARLRGLGIPTPDWRVVTASEAAARTLAARYPGAPVWVVGMDPLRALVAAQGLRVLNRQRSAAPDDPAVGPEQARAVLVGLHRMVTYEDLRLGLRALLAGADLWGVNRDAQLPVEDGFDPGCGALLAALEVASHQTAQFVGKPAPLILLDAMRALGADPARTAIIGDGLAMDIAAGQAAGIATILVLSGITPPERAAAADPPPTLILPDIGAVLAEAMRAAGG